MEYQHKLYFKHFKRISCSYNKSRLPFDAISDAISRIFSSERRVPDKSVLQAGTDLRQFASCPELHTSTFTDVSLLTQKSDLATGTNLVT